MMPMQLEERINKSFENKEVFNVEEEKHEMMSFQDIIKKRYPRRNSGSSYEV